MIKLFPIIAPLLALLIIVRRGSSARRVKVNALWRFPIIIAALCVTSLANGKMPGLLALAMYAAAVPAGALLGWFTAQHVELTLDETTGTITSKPTPFGTAITAGAFLARFAVDYFVKGGSPGHPSVVLVGAANAALLFVAARGLAGAWHMWIRTRPLIAQHKAAQVTSKETG